MSSKIYDVGKYSVKADDRLFFDANIWKYLWSPPHEPSHALKSAIEVYSALYSEMVKQGIKILTSWLVLSEFVNILSRNSYETHNKLHPGANTKFKDYRDSKYFIPEREVITSYVKKILGKSMMISHKFDSVCCDNILRLYESSADFNDAVYAEDSIVTHYKIVTHDKDFKRFSGAAELTILTANAKMLSI
ncbi:MAG: hypothetical protein FWF87_08430 [Synergistaceae bacterium]|nr:hypothetical protein [Synergistaceae bacterium]